MKIIGYLVVGTGEADRYLPKVIDNLLDLVDEIVIASNATDKKTQDFLSDCFLTSVYNFTEYEWGKEQWKIKESLFKRYVATRNPDWVVCLDADEIFDKRITRHTLEELAQREEVAYTFYCVQLWDKEDQMRVDGGWGNFRNVRYFKYIPNAPLNFQRTPLHCGLAPMYAYRWAADSEYLFKHYGYLKEEDRKNKIERYKKYDPGMIYRSREWYESIGGKPELRLFDEGIFGAKLHYNPKKISEDRIAKKTKKMKTYYIRNKRGAIWPVNEQIYKDIWEERVRKGEATLVHEGDATPKMVEAPVIESNPLECQICGFISKSKIGSISHKRKHK